MTEDCELVCALEDGACDVLAVAVEVGGAELV